MLPSQDNMDAHYTRVQQWNAVGRPYPRDKCLAELCARFSHDTPQACAVRDGERHLSYAELDGRANAVAHALVERGVQIGQNVGVLGQRCIEAIVAILGILKAGAVYVPLDAGYPSSRLRAMAEDVGVTMMIALPGTTAELGGIVHMQVDDRMMPHPPALPRLMTGRDLAYIMFTSGSTGRPKAIGVRQLGVTRLVVNTNYIEFTASDRVLYTSSLSFDTSTFEIWGALLHGGCLVVTSSQVLLSPRDLRRLLERQAITIAFFTTAVFHHLAREKPDLFSGIRHVVVAGEVLKPELARRVLAHQPPQRLINAYGPTENTTFSTTYLVNNLADDADTVPIGTPIANTTCYILRDDGTLADIGEEGELVTGGDGVALGYLNDPELTARKFMRDPFCDDPAALLYRTGDRASWRDDGTIEFHGRLDTQLKIHGYRIEASEIEAVLCQHSAIADAVVTRNETNTAGDAQLVGHFVTTGDQEPPSPEELREHLGRRLPSYMIPASFNRLDRLPLSPGGKVDRKALSAAPNLAPGTSDPVQKAMTILEQVRTIWKEVLREKGVERDIDSEDTLFDIGGDSFDVPVIHARLTALLNLSELTPLDLFSYPSLRRYAEHVASLLGIPSSIQVPSASSGKGSAICGSSE